MNIDNCVFIANLTIPTVKLNVFEIKCMCRFMVVSSFGICAALNARLNNVNHMARYQTSFLRFHSDVGSDICDDCLVKLEIKLTSP